MRGIRINFVGLWKNSKDTCKRAGVSFEVLEMPNRGKHPKQRNMRLCGILVSKVDFYSAKWVDD